MASKDFADALEVKVQALEGEQGNGIGVTVAAIALNTGYSVSTVNRHRSGARLPREEGAERYAAFLGDGKGDLMAAWHRDRQDRDIGAVRAHLHGIAGTVATLAMSALFFACPALGGNSCQMVRAPVSPRKTVVAFRKADPRRRRTAPRGKR